MLLNAFCNGRESHGKCQERKFLLQLVCKSHYVSYNKVSHLSKLFKWGGSQRDLGRVEYLTKKSSWAKVKINFDFKVF